MKPLEPSDILHVQAAQGWLELGNPIEADAELDKINATQRGHPTVLEVRLSIYMAAKKWEAALDIATAWTKMVPNHLMSWFQKSFCLHELKRTSEARNNLLAIVDKFPRNALLRYELACYECRLGKLREARDWLERAFELGDPQTLKFMVLEDPDLE